MNKDRLQELHYKITKKTASSAEKMEYIEMLYANDSITEGQYADYKKGYQRDEIIKFGLIVGAAILLGWIIAKMAD
jgi:hypothetical protein